MSKYRVHEGAIVDQFGAILYEPFCIADFSDEAKERLAAIHTGDPEIDWEHAADILIRERLLEEWRESSSDNPATQI